MNGLDAAAQASLPIIDLAALQASDPSVRANEALALRRACIDVDFFYLTGHGLPEAALEAVFAGARPPG